MIARVMEFCGRRRWLVLVTYLGLILIAEIGRRRVPLDAVPDLSDPEVVLVTRLPGHSTEDVQTLVTGPLADGLRALEGVKVVRGTSMPGLSFLHVLPVDGAERTAIRRRVEAAVDRLRPGLPEAAHSLLGADAGATGWIHQYALVWVGGGPITLNLRRVQERLVKPALRDLPGVAEVASVGGAQEAYHVEVDPSRLAIAGLDAGEVAAALRRAVRGAAADPMDWLSALPVTPKAGGPPVALRDVARLRLGPTMEMGSADWNGSGAAVGGIVLAKPDADVREVIRGIDVRMAELRTRLPRGVDLVTVYDRSDLIDRASRMLVVGLIEEIAVVCAVALLFLLHVRSALLPLVTLPLVAFLPFVGLWLFGVQATIMSLAGVAISLGMAVDAELVMLEACHKRLETAPSDLDPPARGRLLMLAARETTPAMVASLIVAAVIFLPVFAFTDETGRLLRPLATTKTMVILAAALVSVTLAPVLRDLVLRGRVPAEAANPLSRGLLALYRPFVQVALQRPVVTMIIGALAILSCLPLTRRLGSEFMPVIDEGDLLFMPTTMPGGSLHVASQQLEQQHAQLMRFPEVASVFGKVGRADAATDPAPGNMIETNIRLRPGREWPAVVPMARWHSRWADGAPAVARRALSWLWPERRPRTLPELIATMNQQLGLVGWTNAWTMPIRGRADMLSTGIRTAFGVRVVASSAERLTILAAQCKGVIGRLAGVRGVADEAGAKLRTLAVVPDRDALERHGVDGTRLRAVVAAALAPIDAGVLSEAGQDRPVMVKYPRDLSNDPVALGELPVPTRMGPGTVPVALLGEIAVAESPAMLTSEDGHLVDTLHVDLTEGRDVVAFAAEARAAIDAARGSGALQLGPDETVRMVGQHELVRATKQRLLLVVPAVAALAILLLALLFRRLAEVLIVVVSVPFALLGSVWSLYLLDYRLSAAVWVGILALIGLALQTGVVMVVYLDQAFYRRLRAGRVRSLADIVAAHMEGSAQRLRPKLMTVATMLLGLAPLLWATGAGAEITKRIAAPMMGGVLTSAFLTLEIIPVLHTRWRHAQLRRAQRTGRPLEEVVGPPPGWARS